MAKTKVEVVKELQTLETQYCNLTEKCLEMEQIAAMDKDYITNLHESNGKLLEELDSIRAKVDAFKRMLEQEQEVSRCQAVLIENMQKNQISLDEEILEQFGAIKTMVENAETLLLTE